MSTEDGADSFNQGSGSDPLFQGKKFWLSQSIPQRSWFKELITENGGNVSLQEKDADVKLVDHKRKNLPSDTYSYKYVEDSIRNKQLARLEDYRAGPSQQRPVGATYIPSRGIKVVYSMGDDQLLWDYVQQFEEKTGVAISGNKIYQDLAARNPRHTWQSYRDRYLKRLRGRPRPGGMVESAVQASDAGPNLSAPSRDLEPASSHRQSPASTTGQIPIVHEMTIDKTSSKAPSTTAEERPQQRMEPKTDKSDDRKRKRSSNIEPTGRSQSRQQQSPEQKRRRALEPRARETRTPETAHRNDKEPERGRQNQPEQSENEVDSLFLELPFFPATPTPEPEEERSSQPDIDDWIDDHIRSGRAQNDAQVIEALRCTSMDPDLADKIMGNMVAGKGIPDDMPGVWTSEDDRCLEGANARDIERVLEKHGTDYFNVRWEYLGLARDAGLENTDDQ